MIHLGGPDKPPNLRALVPSLNSTGPFCLTSAGHPSSRPAARRTRLPPCRRFTSAGPCDRGVLRTAPATDRAPPSARTTLERRGIAGSPDRRGRHQVTRVGQLVWARCRWPGAALEALGLDAHPVSAQQVQPSARRFAVKRTARGRDQDISKPPTTQAAIPC